MTTKLNTLLSCGLLTLFTLNTAQAQAQAKEFTFNHSAKVGIGYNSNIYRTHDGTYTDWADNATPIVNPNVQSGFFIPLQYSLGGSYGLNDKTTLLGGANIKEKLYLGSDLTNANESKYKLDFGAIHTLAGKKRRVSTIHGNLFIDSVDKTYYDRDTGLEKIAGVTDVADRYSYRGHGVQLTYKNRTDQTFKYGGGLTLGSRDYTDTIANSQMDYDYTILEADIDYQLQKATALSAGIKNEVQDYDERPSRNLAGSLFLSNPVLEYTYLTLSFGVKHRLNDNWVLHGDYKNIERDDSWVNYNGYTAHKFKLRAIHKRDNTRTKLSLSTQTRDYPNALAFDDPVNGVNINKTYDTFGWSLSREIEQTQHRSLWGKIAYHNTDTNDLRYNYDRFIVSAGYQWKY